MDLEHDIIIGAWFRPFRGGGSSISTFVQNLRNGDRAAIASAMENLKARGLLVPDGVSQTDGETVYYPSEGLWRERERALHALGWRRPALLNQQGHRPEDLVVAILMAPRIFNSRISGPYLPDSIRRFRAEIAIYLYKLPPEDIDSACKALVDKHMVREGTDEYHGKHLASLELTADGVVAYGTVASTLGLLEGQTILDLDIRTEIVVFLVWQGDYSTSRNQIGSALKELVDRLNKENVAARPLRIDAAVDVGDGAVRIDQNLLDRILGADVVVADVTPVYRAFGRLTPNPNVLLEVGYALASKKPHEIFLIEGKRTPDEIPGDSQPATQLPFDIATVHRMSFGEPKYLRSRLGAEFEAFLKRKGWRVNAGTPANQDV